MTIIDLIQNGRSFNILVYVYKLTIKNYFEFFLHDNEVIRDNFYAYKEILNRRPFLNKVYSKKVAVHQYGTIRQTKQWHKTITTF